MDNAFVKVHPREYFRRFLQQQTRPDGRSLRAARQVEVRTGTLSNCAGSALAAMGRTKLLCGIKCEVCTPSAVHPRQGRLEVNVRLTPVCAREFAWQKATSTELALSQRLRALLIDSGALDLDELCITENRYAWCLYVDLVCLEYAGNVFDCALLAITAALHNVRLPHTVVDEEVRVASAVPRQQRRQLRLRKALLPVSFALVNIDGAPKALLDSSVVEEDNADAQVHVVFAAPPGALAGESDDKCQDDSEEANNNDDGDLQLVEMWKPGGAALGSDVLKVLLAAARTRALEMQTALLS
ncbi:MAG: hypothetical protein MHM6MM_008635 [Cercozoa sp. M6MM]